VNTSSGDGPRADVPRPDHPQADHSQADLDHTDVVEPAAGGQATPVAPAPASVRRTRLSGTWVALIVAMVVLIFLLIFILQNLDNATVRFLGAAGTLPLGVAMLLATVAGALLVSLVGTARILQLRRHAAKQRRGAVKQP
jgi:uncharacterized integral membrane protein